MKTKITTAAICVICILICEIGVSQNVGINQPNPDASALLDLTSTDQGLLIPRMTLSERGDIDLSGSPTGVLIYQTDNTPGFYYYNGTVWQRLIIDGNTNWDNTYGFITSPDDADADPTNEYNTGMGWDNGTNTVSVTDGGGTKSVVLTGFLESEVDASTTNELITVFTWTDGTDLLRITEAGTNWDVTIDNEADDVTLADVQSACTNDFHNIGGTDAVNDADNVIGNEYNTSMGWNDGTNTVSVTDGGGTQSVVITGFDNYNNWKLQANGGTTTNITSGAIVNFAQSGATTVSRAANTITISSTDNNTWQQNTQAQNGYVLAGSGNNDKVWKTDASGNPAWRDDAGAGTCSHSLGESYGGGKIFILDYSGCHGLISATDDQSTSAEWNISNLDPLIGGTYSWLMTGANNTNLIVAGYPGPTQGEAAKICQDLVLGGYTNWFLPSKDELDRMYMLQDIIGNFTASGYWSSTEVDVGKAWSQIFGTGVQSSNTNKTTNLDVRCIRHF